MSIINMLSKICNCSSTNEVDSMGYEDESEELLATHEQPTDESIVEITEPSLSEKSKAAKVLQEHIKSFNRFQTHCKCFGTTPQSTLLPTNKMLQEVPKTLDLIDQLANENAIISPVVSHITTKSNLSSVCAQGALFGADALKRRTITFNENCLSSVDIENGDGNVICFGDKLIDPRALGRGWEAISLKKEVLHIKMDLSKINPSKGKYNQFFKITDLGAPSFCYQLKATSWFSIDFLKTMEPEYCITFQINNTQKSVLVEKKDLVFYGDIYQINKFCLLSLFKFVEMTGDKDFIDSFYSELKNSSPEEITKILKLYGQHLTLFSEYNFNHSLECTPGLFKEIYDLASGICYPLGKLGTNEYQTQITAIAEGNFSNIPHEEKKLNCYTLDENGKIIRILNRTIDNLRNLAFTDVDYSSWDSTAFTNPNFTNFFELGQTHPKLEAGNSVLWQSKVAEKNYPDAIFLWANFPKKIKNEVNKEKCAKLKEAEGLARDTGDWLPFNEMRDALIKEMLENQSS